jgi:putative aldouronate transport system substrate-binding protein
LYKTPLVGFSFDSSSVKNEMAAHRNVLSKYMNILANGVVDPVSTAAKLKAEDKAAGIDKVIAEYEKQVKAFLAIK